MWSVGFIGYKEAHWTGAKWCGAAQVDFLPNGYIFEFGGNGQLGWPDSAGSLHVELIPTSSFFLGK